LINYVHKGEVLTDVFLLVVEVLLLAEGTFDYLFNIEFFDRGGTDVMATG